MRVVVAPSVAAREVEKALADVEGVAGVAHEGDGRYLVKATAKGNPGPASPRRSSGAAGRCWS
ncbi:MAG: hypothetical protein IPG72_00010 [Ardenticatenales bacterium]|nr:hypothetical protein [Ardenticatenales bacterium]